MISDNLNNYELQETIQEDGTFESLLESLAAIINFLNNAVANDSKEMYTEPVLAAPEPLLTQFAGRQVFTSTGLVDEHLTSNYWLSIPSDESEADPENVSC